MFSRPYTRIIVWHNLNNNTYYSKPIKGYRLKYFIGMINNHNHAVILIIDLFALIKMPKTKYKKEWFRKKDNFYKIYYHTHEQDKRNYSNWRY